MNFRASFCDPFIPDIIELGTIPAEQVIQKFEGIQWPDYLLRMENAKEEDTFYSPSLEIENKSNMHGLSISAVGKPDKYEFYIFYKRPKQKKIFFGLKTQNNKNYITDKTGFTKKDVLECLNAFLRNDTEYLEERIGR